MFSPEQVAQACGAPLGNVQAAWPLIESALERFGINDRPTRIAAASTVAVESGSFLPIAEYGDYNYFLQEFGSPYEAQFHGRGFLQLSWSYNYRKYGSEMGVNLVDNPNMALRADIAANVLALYFRDCGIPWAARQGDWPGVRRRVNGGENGWDVFIQAVDKLSALPEVSPAQPTPPTVAMTSILRTEPEASGEHAINAQHQPVVLQVGDVVHFEPDPSGPFKGEITTPNWCHVLVGTGPIHGWVQRANLKAGS